MPMVGGFSQFRRIWIATITGVLALVLAPSACWASPPSSTPSSGFPTLTSGAINAIAADGSGGWYVGGSFTSIGGQTRNNAAHILANGTVDSWNPNLNGAVNTIAVSGTNVYLGGAFTTVGGQTRNRAAAVGTNGTLQTWNPNVSGGTGPTVSALAISGSTVYLGGTFTKLGTTTRNDAAAVGTDGTLQTWNPNLNGAANTIAVSGTNVYLGGAFTTVGGTTRNRAAAVGTNGTLQSWNPNLSSTVKTMLVSGSNIYMVGSFTTVGGVTRNRAAAVATSGTLQSWNPNIGTTNTVGLAISGLSAYVGGDFLTVGGQTRNHAAGVDNTNGTLQAWNPNLGTSTSEQVSAIVTSASSVVIGGSFTTVGGTSRRGFAYFAIPPPAAPTVTGPSGTINTTTPQWTISGEAGATLYCKLDAGGFAPCTSPYSPGPFADGSSHTVQFKQIADSGGESSVVSRTVTIDTTPPAPPTVNGPSGSTDQTQPTYTFSGESGGHFECAVDSGAYATCTSPTTFGPFSNGSTHTIHFRQVDDAGNTGSPTDRTITIDNRALPDTITSDQTWSAGAPYTGGSVTINPGVTVTVNPGAIIQLSGTLIVNGTLDVNGTAASPAVFTSSSDSAPGQWYGIYLTTSTSSLDHAVVRYARNGVELSGGSITPSITNSTIDDNAWTGLVSDGSPTISGNVIRNNGIQGISAGRGGPEIANNTISNNAGEGIKYRPSGSNYSGAVNIHDNTVSGNGGTAGIYIDTNFATISGTSLAGNTVTGNAGKAILYYGGNLPADIDENPQPSGNGSNATWVSGVVPASTTWSDHGYPIVLQAGVQVASGATLTLSPGLVLKAGFPGQNLPGNLSVLGAINAQGTAQNPITITSIYDDSIDGDTDGGGSSPQPAARDWGYVYVDPSSSSSVFDHLVIRYGGGGYQPVLQTNANTTAVSNSTIRDNYSGGLSVGGGSPAITGNTITHNSAAGISGGAGSPEIANNTITDNTGSFYSSGIDFQVPSNQTATVNIHGNDVEGNGGLAGISVTQSQYASGVVGQSIGNNTLRNNAGRALQYTVSNQIGTIPADIDTMPAPTGNGSNAVWVSGRVASSTTWDNAGYPYVFTAGWGITVDQGVTFGLAPGVILKGDGTASNIDVWGTLNAQGTAGNPVTITSVKDDSVGGDTNGDGAATSPAPGDWGRILLGYKNGSTAGAGTFDQVNASYGGAGVGGMFNLSYQPSCGCDRASTITHSRIVSATTGVYVSGDPTGSAVPNISRDALAGNRDFAIYKGGTSVLHSPYDIPNCASGFGPAGCGDLMNSLVDNTPTAPAAGNNCDGDKGCSHGNSDPVALPTGALTYGHTDLTLTNKSREPLVLRRNYNSDDPTDAGFGPGWSYTGLIRITEEESGDVVVRQGDGRADLYISSGGAYIPPSGIHDTLEKQGDGTFKLTTPAQTVYRFDATGRIATITDDHGLVITYGYNSSGRLATITDPSSQTLSFGYNASNHITSVTDSTGRSVSYTYSSAGDLETVTDPLNGVTHYGYDSQHRLTSITDPRNVTFLTNTYDSQGRVTDQVDGENNHWTLGYGSGQTSVTEPEGGTRTYVFDSQDRLTSETDELGHATTYHYNAAGDVDQVSRPGSASWSFGHDSAGNLTSITDPMAGQQSISYDSANHPTSYTDARNKTWSYTWAANNLTRITDPGNGETDFTYNSAGQPLTVTDPNQHTTTNAYDSRGNRTSVTDALNHTTSYDYNTRNYLTSKTEPGKPAETYTRSALGDLLSVTTPANHTTSYSYDANGAPTGKTDPANNTWTITRNGMERPTSYTDPLNHSIDITYNGDLMPVTVTDRRGKTTTYSYSAANQLTGIQRPEGDTWAFGYDARGNRTSVTDPRNHTTAYTYDLLDRMTSTQEPLNSDTAYGYDAAGNLTSLIDPNGNQTTFDYDALGHRTAIHQPLGKDTSFTYDPAGNLVGRTTGMGSLEYSYDDANRLTGISANSNPLRSYSYDSDNRLTGATDAQNKTIIIGYDGEDHVASLDDGRGQTVSRSFDSRGNLTGQTDGRGTQAFGYDALDRMTSLTDPQSNSLTFGYDNEGNLTEADLPNGVVTTNSYDGDGRMTQTSSVKSATTLQSFSYGYDATSNRTSQTDRNNDQTTYTYDDLNRLTQFAPPNNPAVSYSYDNAGNRTAAGGTTYSYNDLNQLTSSSDGTSYSYDSAGRLTAKQNGSQTTTYNWDPLDQLAGVDDSSNPVTYSYDGLGRRSERTAGSATTTDHYGDLSDRPILMTDATPAITQTYVQEPTGLVEERSGSATTYPLDDAHGDITTVSDGAGDVSSREAYDPWGSQLSGPALQNGYLGAYQRPTDTTTGLIQMGLRSLDPSSGRFLTEDPVLLVKGSGPSCNRYAYVYDNPLNRYDLDGRVSLPHLPTCPAPLNALLPPCQAAQQVNGAINIAQGLLDVGQAAAGAVGRLADFIKNHPCVAADSLVIGGTVAGYGVFGPDAIPEGLGAVVEGAHLAASENCWSQTPEPTGPGDYYPPGDPLAPPQTA
jgi:RHS repeat-associated protein